MNLFKFQMVWNLVPLEVDLIMLHVGLNHSKSIFENVDRLEANLVFQS